MNYSYVRTKIFFLILISACSGNQDGSITYLVNDFLGAWESECQTSFNDESNLHISVKIRLEFNSEKEYVDSIYGYEPSTENNASCQGTLLILSSFGTLMI